MPNALAGPVPQFSDLLTGRRSVELSPQLLVATVGSVRNHATGILIGAPQSGWRPTQYITMMVLVNDSAINFGSGI